MAELKDSVDEVSTGPAVGQGLEACPACGCAAFGLLFSAADRRFGTTSQTFQVVECRDCRLIRMEPCPTPEELRQYYPPRDVVPVVKAHELSVKGWLERAALGSKLRFTERALHESGETGLVLDVGCGEGRFLHFLRRRGAQNITGLAFSVAAAADAWRAYGVPAVCATLSRPPFVPGTVSVITMFQVLQRLYDPVNYLEAARDLLTAEGRLIIQVPNARSWQFLIFGSHWAGLDIPRQLILFKADDVENLLKECGFEVIRRRDFCLRDNPAMLVSSVFGGLDPVARKSRGVREGNRTRFGKNAAFYLLCALATPVALLEAACNAGATVMFEARKRT